MNFYKNSDILQNFYMIDNYFWVITWMIKKKTIFETSFFKDYLYDAIYVFFILIDLLLVTIV